MPIIEAPDGTEIEFPEGMGMDKIQSVMRQKFPPQQAAEAVTQMERPKKSPSFMERANQSAIGMANELFSGLQHTSPITTNLKGEQNYEHLGEVIETKGGQYISGIDRFEPFDSSKHIFLIDQQTGKTNAFLRNEAMAENSASSLGRVIGVGNLTNQIAPGVKVISATRKATGELAKDFADHNVRPTLATATQHRGGQILENSLGSVVTSAKIIKNAHDGTVDQISTAVERLAARYGEGATAVEAGEALKKGGKVWLDKFKEVSGKLYDRIGMENTDSVNMAHTLEALKGPIEKFKTLPAFGDLVVPPKFQKFFEQLSSSNSGEVSWDVVKDIRSAVGRLSNDPKAIIGDITTKQWDDLYGALSDDLRAAAAAKSPKHLMRFERANEVYKAGRERIKEVLSNALRDDVGAEAVFDDVKKLGKKNARTANIKKLRALRSSMPKRDWDTAAAVVLRNMGEGSDGFSVGTFLTSYSKISPEARTTLFNTGRYSELKKNLDSLVRVMKAQKETQKTVNTSNTSGQIVTTGIMSAGAGGGFSLAALSVATSSFITAKLITNPSFVKWMSQMPKAKTRTQIASHLSKLRLLAEANPELKGDVTQFAQSLNTEKE